MLYSLENSLKQKDAYDFLRTEKLPIVNSFNEWDPLEEVIVGVVDGACVPSWDIAIDSVVPDNQKNFYKTAGGTRFSELEVALAKKDLAEFVHILEAEGITVKRPDVVDYKVPFSTMEWTSSNGFYAAMPRDTLLVVGNEIIEAPMAWRSRYFECNAYRNLLKDYFRKGSKWSAGPKPQLNDELFNYDYAPPEDDQEMSYVISEYEPTFDAADFTRCGKDIFAQKSHVTNDFGIKWLQRHLGDDYKIHTIEVNDKHPMHIDATLVPLAPGKLLIHRDRITEVPEMFKSWDILRAPDPCMSKNHTLYMTSRWLNMNILMLDHTRVMVEKDEKTMIKALRDFGLGIKIK